jgi:CRISPR-associated exonuclease Cas4
MCLEEMLAVAVPRGQLFYGQKRRRFDVEFDDALREATRRAALRLHEIVDGGITPPAVREKKCDTCSLLEICMPDALGPRKSARRFFERQLEVALTDE